MNDFNNRLRIMHDEEKDLSIVQQNFHFYVQSITEMFEYFKKLYYFFLNLK